MATGQAVKVRSNTSTKGAKSAISSSTSQLVNQQQSQELAQTLVHGSISTIAFLRDLFPDKCFDEQVYSSSDRHVPYKDYAAGKSQSQSRTGHKIRALQRGQHENVDAFLDTLEKGAFEALEKKVLRAIQINISEQADEPNHVVESYTFTFSYQISSKGAKTLAGVTMQDPNGADTTVKNVKYALHMFIRKIVALCQTLPELPAKRYLHMQLYYTDDCERDYEPPGFAACKDTRLWFAGHQGWTRQTDECGILDAGCHAVSLKLSHLQQDLGVAATKDDDTHAVLPEKLQYMTAGLGQDDIDASIGSRLAKRKLVQRAAAENSTAVSQEDVLNQRQHTPTTSPQQELMDVDEDHPIPAIGQISLETPENLTQAQAPKITPTDTQVSTQTREDRATRGRLEKMMIPSPQAQNAGETQLVDSSVAGLNVQFFSQMPQLRLSEAKTRDLETRKSPRNTRGRARKVSDSGEIDTVSCECGYNGEEDDMVHCCFCEKWQHLVCYGYQGPKDPRMPEIHACYKCLLQEKERPLLTELEHLTLLRKGASVAMKEGIHGDRQFAEALHCDTQTAAKLIKHLKNEGFLVRTPNSSKASYKRTGRPIWHVVEKVEERAKLQSLYFDPTTKIAHHFEIPQPLSDTVKSTQFSLPPGYTETSVMERPSVIESSRQDNGAMAVPDSTMETTAEDLDPEASTAAMHHRSRSLSQMESLTEGTQRRETSTAMTTEVTSTSHAKRAQLQQPQRNLNILSPSELASKRPAPEHEDWQDEPTTPTLGRKRIKASRAPFFNVGRSPTASVASPGTEASRPDDEDAEEDDHL